MRTFWSLIIVSTLAVLILWLLQEGPARGSAPSPFNQNVRAPQTEATTPLTADPEDAQTTSTAELEKSDQSIAAGTDSENQKSPSEADPATLENQLLASAEDRDDLPELTVAEESTTDSDNSDPDSTQPGLTLGLDKSIPYVTITPGRIIRSMPDQLEIDGEFTLKGSGTKEDPYLPSWDYLFSAGTTYKPRIGKDELPQRIALLDGAWVTISGHTAFPLVVGETNEMLVMLNQWDGCCIGVPPTPFDALEVRLQKAVQTGPKHSFNYGTVTGRMKVDPYLIENWLVGLYILEESDLQNDL